MPYGVFVDVTSNISGLLHVSEIFEKQGNFDVSKVFTEGEKVKVKVTKIEDGKVSFSVKGVEQDSDLLARIEAAPIAERTFDRPQGDRGGNRRGGFNGGDRRNNGGGDFRRSRY
jgi:predicted RNA-binding protein with RPS1 domain